MRDATGAAVLARQKLDQIYTVEGLREWNDVHFGKPLRLLVKDSPIFLVLYLWLGILYIAFLSYTLLTPTKNMENGILANVYVRYHRSHYDMCWYR
eukprot:UN07025